MVRVSPGHCYISPRLRLSWSEYVWYPWYSTKKSGVFVSFSVWSLLFWGESPENHIKWVLQWVSPGWGRWGASLDTIDPGMEKLMRIWPQEPGAGSRLDSWGFWNDLEKSMGKSCKGQSRGHFEWQKSVWEKLILSAQPRSKQGASKEIMFEEHWASHFQRVIVGSSFQ